MKAAWVELQELQVPGAPPEDDGPGLGERLAALARALPSELAGRREWAARILALDGSPQEMEAALAVLDRDLLAAAAAALSNSEAESLDLEVEEALRRLSRRLPVSELDALRQQLRRQHLRLRANLPLLTLFGTVPAPSDPSR